jgi:hypothetical protein
MDGRGGVEAQGVFGSKKDCQMVYIFSYQIPKFWYLLEGTGMKYFDIFYYRLVYAVVICFILKHLVVICYFSLHVAML